MPFNLLDSCTALMGIDVQQDLPSREGSAVRDVIQRAGSLAAAFRVRNLPVVLVQVVGTPPGCSDVHAKGVGRTEGRSDLLGELQTPQDLHVTNRVWSASGDRDLDRRLRMLEVTQVALSGVSTSLGVESPARRAFGAGYNVPRVTDAMLDRTRGAAGYPDAAVPSDRRDRHGKGTAGPAARSAAGRDGLCSCLASDTPPVLSYCPLELSA